MTVTRAIGGSTFGAHKTFEIITCCTCGMPFGVPDHWKQNRLEDRERFWCPNGHPQSYCKSEAQRLREELKKKDQQIRREEAKADEARRQRDATRKSHRRMRHRVKNGVCPCCNRTFQNLLQHMRTQHPELGEQQTLRQVRQSYGLTQGDLAREIGVQQSHVSCFECGRSVTTWARDQIEAWLEDQGGAS